MEKGGTGDDDEGEDGDDVVVEDEAAVVVDGVGGEGERAAGERLSAFAAADADADVEATSTTSPPPPPPPPKRKLSVPFFARFNDEATAATTTTTTREAKKEKEEKASEGDVGDVAAASKEKAKERASDPLATAMERAKALKAAAARATLEAERMDAELSLNKIDRLEEELERESKSGMSDGDGDSDDGKWKMKLERAVEIRSQIEQLRKRLEGDDGAGVVASRATTVSPLYDVSDLGDGKVGTKLNLGPLEDMTYEGLSREEMTARVQKFDRSPKFMRDLISGIAGVEGVDDGGASTSSEVNSTELIMKLHRDEQRFIRGQLTAQAEFGAAISDRTDKPRFSREQIENKERELSVVPQFMKNLFGEDGKNSTLLAIRMLEEEWEGDKMGRSMGRSIMGKGDDAKKGNDAEKDSDGGFGSGLFGSGGGGGLIGGDNDSNLPVTPTEQMMMSQYPKSVRKDDGTGPTESQANILCTDVLGKIKLFNPNGKPEAVPGGYLIRGTNGFDEGGDLINALDAGIAKNSGLRGKISVHYVPNPTPPNEAELAAGGGESRSGPFRYGGRSGSGG